MVHPVSVYPGLHSVITTIDFQMQYYIILLTYYGTFEVYYANTIHVLTIIIH